MGRLTGQGSVRHTVFPSADQEQEQEQEQDELSASSFIGSSQPGWVQNFKNFVGPHYPELFDYLEGCSDNSDQADTIDFFADLTEDPYNFKAGYEEFKHSAASLLQPVANAARDFDSQQINAAERIGNPISSMAPLAVVCAPHAQLTKEHEALLSLLNTELERKPTLDWLSLQQWAKGNWLRTMACLLLAAPYRELIYSDLCEEGNLSLIRDVWGNQNGFQSLLQGLDDVLARILHEPNVKAA